MTIMRSKLNTVPLPEGAHVLMTFGEPDIVLDRACLDYAETWFGRSRSRSWGAHTHASSTHKMWLCLFNGAYTATDVLKPGALAPCPVCEDGHVFPIARTTTYLGLRVPLLLQKCDTCNIELGGSLEAAANVAIVEEVHQADRYAGSVHHEM